MGKVILNGVEYQGGGVSDVEVNGSSVVNAQGVAEVTAVQDNPTFTEAQTRANIASGESFATILGKIKKFFTDLKTVAFSGSYNDLTDKPTIPDISTKVSKSGDTMTGELEIRRATGVDAQYRSTNTTNGYQISFGWGSGGTNRGIWDTEFNTWIFQSTGTNVYVNGSIVPVNKTLASTDQIPTNNNQLTNGAGYITDSDVTKLHPYAGRPASANTQFGDGTCRYFLASSSMSTGKPSGDAHILHMSWDNAGGWDAQLALVNGAERELQYRQQTSGTWGDWKTVRNTVRYRFQTGGSVNGTWYKMFQIAYSSYNVCTLRMIVKVGYMPMCEVDACIRFAPSGVSSSASSYIIKNLGGGVYDGGIRVKMFLVSTNTVGFAVQPFGSASDYGFEILDISSESQAIGVNQISVSSPFEQLPSEPTSFGVQIEEIISKNGHTTINELEAEDYLQIYSTSFAKSVFLKAPSTISTDRQISLPNKDGTIALTSDISSRRYKENIIPLSEDEAKKILDVEIVNYDYKEGVVEEDERYDQKGAIAEDVAELIPNAVTYADVDGEQLPDGINYTKFIPYLIKMVQIQQKEIERLKELIK